MKGFFAIVKGLLTVSTDNFFTQLLRYGIVGAIAFIIDYGLLLTFTEYVGLHYILSATLSFIAGLTVNYILSVKWVFNTSVISDRRIEFILFAVIGVIGLLINDITMFVLTEFVHIPYWLCKLGSAVVVYFWNFIGRKTFVFGQRKTRQASNIQSPLSHE